jgi:hypothetical protein
VNLDLSVRDPPLVAVLVVLFGIAMGRIARDLASPAAQLQLALMPRLYQLGRQAHGIRDIATRDRIQLDLNAVEERIAQATETREAIEKTLEEIHQRILAVLGSQLAEDLIVQPDHAPSAAAVQEEIIQVRQGALAGDQVQTSTSFHKMRKALLAAGGPAAALASQLPMIPEPATAPAAAGRQGRTKGDVLRDWLAGPLAFLSGFNTKSANVRFWLFQPLVYIALLAALVLLGLQTLYINAGATFGVNGVFDYFGLFMWGVSSDIAQRSLQQLTMPR